MLVFLLICFLVGIGIAILAVPFIAIGKTVQYAAQGGLPKTVRCPACTAKQEAPANRPDYDCRFCGTPILRGGQFVRRENTGR